MGKRIFFTACIALVATGLTLNSCDFISGVDVADQGSIDRLLRKNIEKHIGSQSIIYEISLGTTSDFSTEMNVITVTFMEPGSSEVKKYNLTVPGNQEPRDNSKFVDRKLKDRTAEEGVKLSDADFSQIASNVNKGAEIIKPENMNLDGVNNYRITFDKDPSKAIHKFSILSRAGTEFGSRHGRAALVTNYYKVDFKADASGNVTVVE